MECETAGAFAGVRVLLVEDETLVAMMVEDMLGDEGCTVVASAARMSEALKFAEDPALNVDAAILDVNVAGEPIFPVAEALAARGVPFVFSTGYGQSGLPEAWRDRPTLQKPFMAADIVKALGKALGRD